MRILLIGILFGMLLFYAYDCLRIFRRICRHRDALVVLEDFIYSILAGVLLFLLLQNECEGILRYYLVLMILCGMLCYHYLVGRHAVLAVTLTLKTMLSQLGKKKRRLTERLKKTKISISMWLCKHREIHYGTAKKEREEGQAEGSGFP